MNFNTYLSAALNSDPELKAEYDALTPKYNKIKQQTLAEQVKVQLFLKRAEKKTPYANHLFPKGPVHFVSPRNRSGVRISNYSKPASSLIIPVPYYFSTLYTSERRFLIKVLK